MNRFRHGAQRIALLMTVPLVAIATTRWAYAGDAFAVELRLNDIESRIGSGRLNETDVVRFARGVQSLRAELANVESLESQLASHRLDVSRQQSLVVQRRNSAVVTQMNVLRRMQELGRERQALDRDVSRHNAETKRHNEHPPGPNASPQEHDRYNAIADRRNKMIPIYEERERQLHRRYGELERQATGADNAGREARLAEIRLEHLQRRERELRDQVSSSLDALMSGAVSISDAVTAAQSAPAVDRAGKPQSKRTRVARPLTIPPVPATIAGTRAVVDTAWPGDLAPVLEVTDVELAAARETWRTAFWEAAKGLLEEGTKKLVTTKLPFADRPWELKDQFDRVRESLATEPLAKLQRNGRLLQAAVSAVGSGDARTIDLLLRAIDRDHEDMQSRAKARVAEFFYERARRLGDPIEHALPSRTNIERWYDNVRRVLTRAGEDAE